MVSSPLLRHQNGPQVNRVPGRKTCYVPKEFVGDYWYIYIYPIGSMYGIYANIGGILMVNVTIYSIHGSYGYIYIYYYMGTIGNYCGKIRFWKILESWKLLGKHTNLYNLEILFGIFLGVTIQWNKKSFCWITKNWLKDMKLINSCLAHWSRFL